MLTSPESRWTFTASGPDGEFEVPRPVFDTAGLAALAKNADGVEFYPPYEVVLKRDFSGATVKVTSGLSVGDKVVVYRVMLRRQMQPLSTSGPWPAGTVERMIDRLTADLAAAAILLERAIGGSMLDDAIIGNIPAALLRAGKVQGYDDQGRPTVLSNVPLDPAVPVSAFMQSFLLNNSALNTLGDLGFSSFMASTVGNVNASALLSAFGFSAYFRSLVGVADASELRSNIEVTNLAAAFIDNGSCMVAQVTTPVSLTTSPQHSPVDRFSGWASGGAVSAGAMDQNTWSAIGRSACTLRFTGVTLTGSGELAVRCRMEGRTSRRLRNARVSFGVLVSHDVGAAVSYQVHIRKPDVADFFGTTTLIASSPGVMVPSGIGTGTRVKFEDVALGDVPGGLEIEIRVACGAVSGRNFEFTEFVLAEAAVAPAFQNMNTYAADLAACRRWLRMKQAPDREMWSGVCTVGGFYRHSVRFDSPMRAPPTITLFGGASGYGFNTSAPSIDQVAIDGFDAYKLADSSQIDGFYTYSWRSDARMAP